MSETLRAAKDRIKDFYTTGRPWTNADGEAQLLLQKHYLSPPAAGPGFDAEDGLPVTDEWLRSVGKDIGRLEFRIGEPSKSINIDGLGICLPSDMRSWEYCGHPIKTRGQVRLLCLALGITFPPAPNERNGE